MYLLLSNFKHLACFLHSLYQGIQERRKRQGIGGYFCTLKCICIRLPPHLPYGFRICNRYDNIDFTYHLCCGNCDHHYVIIVMFIMFQHSFPVHIIQAILCDFTFVIYLTVGLLVVLCFLCNNVLCCPLCQVTLVKELCISI